MKNMALIIKDKVYNLRGSWRKSILICALFLLTEDIILFWL